MRRPGVNHINNLSPARGSKLSKISLTLRLMLFGIGYAATYLFRPGFLAALGTIHYARFLILPGTDKLLFFSNYGGSWQAYLEDFIIQASVGLTGVWSNTLGFPRANNLVFGGATDGDRFKRWARRQQLPTRFWYSAYPDLMTARVRINAQIRQGLASIATDNEARDWLALFGSAPGAPHQIDTESVQTLALGGLGRIPHASFLLARAPSEAGAARAWLFGLSQSLSFGAMRMPDLAINVAFTSVGLRKLGLHDAQIATFPVAFQDGMAAPWRSQALGDVAGNAPEHWRWGFDAGSADLALLVYAKTEQDLANALAAVRRQLEGAGGAIVAEIATPALPPPEASSPEPFGFEDGVSQPKIRGLRPTSAADRDHIVEPGELLLGYPDNSGYYPPTPVVAASDDPRAALPGLPPSAAEDSPQRDFGCNGTYLVIRQLEQNVEGFWQTVKAAAVTLPERFGAPANAEDATEWVGAKAVGRWRNGDPIVLHPYRRRPEDATDENDFRFGELDAAGAKCPFGAHIRRANPRDSLGADPDTQLAVANRHRILRIGRPYQPAPGGRPGLMFMCLNADIDRQFEFLQQNWIGNPSFAGLRDEVDPLLGAGTEASGRLSVPTPAGPLAIGGFKDFVKVLGGGYFFLPSRQAIAFLCRPR